MTLRAGSYDRAKPDYRGIIRNDGSPWYECYHFGLEKHKTPAEARECAKKALAFIRETNKLPKGWTTYERAR